MYVDLDLIYAKIKKDDRLAAISARILQAKEPQYTSIATLLELEIVLKREVSDYLSRETAQLFEENFPKVKIINLNQKIFGKSLELRRRYNLGIFDSIHAATALLHDKKIATTDSVYKRMPNIKIVSE